MTFLAKHIKSARLWVDWDQRHLAEASGLSLPTIQRMEGSSGEVRGSYQNVLKVRHALESAGVEFIEENGGGPGVRLKSR